MEAAYGRPDKMQQDGVHPNAEGIKAIVEGIAPMVEQLLKK